MEEGKGLERRARLTARKKEEFPGFMENMLPGNSFPQICVVSVIESVGYEQYRTRLRKLCR
jgi:hypothetical protein